MNALVNTDDIDTQHDEPRISDHALARGLGYKSTKELRQSIERNRLELETYGEIIIQEINTRQTEDNYLQFEDNLNLKRGPKATEYLLNEHQALIIATLAKTSQAAALRSEMVKNLRGCQKRSSCPS